MIKIAPPLSAFVTKSCRSLILSMSHLLPLISRGVKFCLGLDGLRFAIHPHNFVLISSRRGWLKEGYVKPDTFISSCNIDCASPDCSSGLALKNAFHDSFLMNSDVSYFKSCVSTLHEGTNPNPLARKTYVAAGISSSDKLMTMFSSLILSIMDANFCCFLILTFALYLILFFFFLAAVHFLFFFS